MGLMQLIANYIKWVEINIYDLNRNFYCFHVNVNSTVIRECDAGFTGIIKISFIVPENFLEWDKIYLIWSWLEIWGEDWETEICEIKFSVLNDLGLKLEANKEFSMFLTLTGIYSR